MLIVMVVGMVNEGVNDGRDDGVIIILVMNGDGE